MTITFSAQELVVHGDVQVQTLQCDVLCLQALNIGPVRLGSVKDRGFNKVTKSKQF